LSSYLLCDYSIAIVVTVSMKAENVIKNTFVSLSCVDMLYCLEVTYILSSRHRNCIVKMKM